MADDPGDVDGSPNDDEAGWAAPDGVAREPADPSPPSPTPPGAQSAGTAPPPLAPIPSPPPGMPAPPGAPGSGMGQLPRRRRGWIVVLVAALAVIAAAVIAGTVLFVDRTAPPFNAAHDFLEDVGAGRSADAARQLCASDRPNAEANLQRVRDTFQPGRTVDVNPFSVDRTGDTATVEYWISGAHLRDFTYVLTVREEGGRWTACPGDGLRRF